MLRGYREEAREEALRIRAPAHGQKIDELNV